MVTSPTRPPGIGEIRRRTTDRIYGLFMVGRLFVAPLIATFSIWILVNDSVLWRQVVMGVVASVIVTVSMWDLLRYRRRGLIGRYTVPRNIIMLGVASGFMVFATGGLESPFLFVFVLVALGNALFAPGRLGIYSVAFGLIPLIWVYAILTIYGLVPHLVPDVFGGGARTPRDDVILWTTAVFLTAILVAILGFGTRLRYHLEQVVREQIDARDEALRMNEEQMRTMTALAGEIAHELKNPLASVKGLGALIAVDAEGRAAQHVAVLRREVDRMQAVLQEFLNFSRPIVPLAQAPVDLGELGREVAELHAGVAIERGISIETREQGSVELVCDARKVRQILINLLQNACDAGPPGSAVAIEVDGTGADAVRLHVLDDGPGLPPSLADRVFEAGVTGKPDGSGLGLPVARLLARQHGGEVTLVNRPGGGCLAELVLPRVPTAAGGGT